ncbi:hypothetical protein LZG75_02085 [Polynucleobacter sp. IMCC30063]|uniref:hypothetical protein n=1 Tax=unclassified Polynucleobacter TaxID=2640945 RepID=UPI001F18380E|nr:MULTISPECIES: hypothetical protein [unclassified Polynucleobacter]MCE7505017.1 hypothetical protein [Polynucleobacter sp. IMCC30063]MCE7526191.1 hypothetical protein [Polynucleobacter sp. IMCC 30228]
MLVIIDMMALLMGIVMGFLAFLLLGGAVGWSAWYFYPARKTPSNRGGGRIKGIIGAIGAGFIGAWGGSFLALMGALVKPGQMLEWFIAILAAWMVAAIYTSFTR